LDANVVFFTFCSLFFAEQSSCGYNQQEEWQDEKVQDNLQYYRDGEHPIEIEEFRVYKRSDD
jgi:hypothetical protein